MSIIYYIFSMLQVFTATFLFFSSNPVHSILFLILLFFESTVILSLLNLEFISLLFILVYVGAIAVLFLFVVMMLRVKLNDLGSLVFLPINFGLNAYILIFILSLYQPFTYSSQAFYSTEYLCFTNIEEHFGDIFVLGQLIYNYAIILLLIAGFILLVALLGSIVLSLDFSKSRTNSVVFRRLSRSSNFISFFK